MILLADALRILVLVVVAGILLLSASIFTAHSRHLSEVDPEHRRSRHIFKVAASHIGALLLLSWELVSRFGEPLTFRAPMGLLLSTLTFSALFDLAVFQKARSYRGDTKP